MFFLLRSVQISEDLFVVDTADQLLPFAQFAGVTVGNDHIGVLDRCLAIKTGKLFEGGLRFMRLMDPAAEGYDVRPGTVETRADSADIDRARSSARPITRLAFRPGAGSSS